MRIVIAFCLGLLIAMGAGCALKPEFIQATPVPQVYFKDLSCEALKLELELATNRLNTLSKRQFSNRNRDSWLNLLIPGIGAAIPNQEIAIGQAKGSIEAIQRQYLRCSTQGFN